MSSSYYYDKYIEKKREAEQIERKIAYLSDVNLDVTSSFTGDVHTVNQTIDDEMGEHKTSVRHNAKYDLLSEKMDEMKPKYPYSDQHLQGISSGIESEISRLKNEKKQAEDDRDYYWREYKDALEREREEKRKARERAFEKSLERIGNSGVF